MAVTPRTRDTPGIRYQFNQIAEPLLTWPYRWRWGITHFALGIYILAFFVLYGRMGAGVASLSTLPVLFAGWLLGARAGFITGILFFPLNTLLLNLAGHAPGGWDVIIRSSGGPGSLLLVFIGAMTGMLAEELWARRRAQEALQDNEQKFRLISEQSLLAIAILQDDRVKYANQALADVIGYTPEEMMSWPAVEFGRHVHPDDLAFAMEQARKKQHGETADVTNYCYRLITRDGQLKWIDQYTKTFRYEDRPAALVTLIDVTARKQAEEALHLRGAALESAANAIVITDREGFITWVNPAFTRLTGFGEAEVLGRNPRFLQSGHQDKAFYQELWDTILAGDVWHGEMVNRRKDGKEYIEDHTITPVCNKQGDITHFISIRRDITEEKAVQQQLQQQERLAAVGQLAAGIAHDFNNTLAVIVLYSQLVQRNPQLGPKDQERLATIYRQAQQAAGLTQQIVDFSRRSLMEPMPMNMLPFLKEMVKLWERTLPESIELALSHSGGEYMVNADPTRLEQVLMNLALNARDAMPDGGRLCLSLSHLSLSAEERPPLVGMEPGHWVSLAISNNGAGIPPDVLPHVFEPFFTTKSPDKGTGLGLAQVYGIVKQHDGFISVSSPKGDDTTFTIYLPLLDVPESLPSVPDSVPLPSGRSERILLVEDDQATRQAIQDTLEATGYQVLVAADGSEALAHLDRLNGAVDLVLSDLVMPDMGGEALYSALQREHPQLRMIVMTGYPLEDNGRALLEQGIVDWVSKPIAVEDLIGKVQESMGSQQQCSPSLSPLKEGSG